MDSASELRSAADGGSLRSVALGISKEAASLPGAYQRGPVPGESLRQPRAQAWELWSVWEKLREPTASQISVCPTLVTEWETGLKKGSDFPGSHSKSVAGLELGSRTPNSQSGMLHGPTLGNN